MKRIFLLLAFFLALDGYSQQTWQWAHSAGGALLDQTPFRQIAMDAAGNMYVTGYFRSASIGFGPFTLTNQGSNTSDIFLVKYNTAGTPVWAVRVGLRRFRPEQLYRGGHQRGRLPNRLFSGFNSLR